MRTSTLFLVGVAITPFAIAASSSKRGLVYVPPKKGHSGDDKIWTVAGSDLTWYYNYGVQPTSSFANTDLEFVPMLWGATAGDTGTEFTDAVEKLVESGQNITYVMSFNEPDATNDIGGSNVLPDVAAETWIREIAPLKKKGIKLGAPAVTGGAEGWAWLQKFFTSCDGKCDADFIPVHWYGNFEGLASHLGGVASTYSNMTIWVTEYALNSADLTETQNFYNQSAALMDRWSNITHYSYFGSFRSDVSNVGPNVAMLNQDGKLTDIGSWYLGGSATGNLPAAGSGATNSLKISATLLFSAVLACSWVGW